MSRLGMSAVVVAGVVVIAALGASGVARAQASNSSAMATPKGWNYEIRDGKRVPKGNRVTNADGSWREELRQGSCVTVKESSAQGEIKITRRCD